LYSEKAAVEQNLVLEQERTSQLSAINQVLTHKVEVGSLLETRELEATAIRHRSNNKEVETRNADKAEMIKVTFNTGKNAVIDHGSEVTFQVRVIGPDGATIAVEPMGSGTMVLAGSGEEKLYTMEKSIVYDNKDKQVTLYWPQQTAFAPGDYTVIVYQSGYAIGETSFDLRDGFLSASR
jgi:hypothetical protein